MREGAGRDKAKKRVISVGYVQPKKLKGNDIYVTIYAMWEGINVQVNSNKTFEYRFEEDKDSTTRTGQEIQFFEYPITSREKTPIGLNQYVFDIHEKFVRIRNFVRILARKNNAKIHSDRAFKEINGFCGGLEKMLKRVKPHLRG